MSFFEWFLSFEVDDDQRDQDPDSRELILPDSLKLGLGDFIFYSVLVGRAAFYDFMTGITVLSLFCVFIFDHFSVSSVCCLFWNHSWIVSHSFVACFVSTSVACVAYFHCAWIGVLLSDEIGAGAVHSVIGVVSYIHLKKHSINI